MAGQGRGGQGARPEQQGPPPPPPLAHRKLSLSCPVTSLSAMNVLARAPRPGSLPVPSRAVCCSPT